MSNNTQNIDLPQKHPPTDAVSESSRGQHTRLWLSIDLMMVRAALLLDNGSHIKAQEEVKRAFTLLEAEYEINRGQPERKRFSKIFDEIADLSTVISAQIDTQDYYANKGGGVESDL